MWQWVKILCVLSVVTVSGPKSAEHDRAMSVRAGDRSRERDVGDRQRSATSASGRNDHSVTSQPREPRQDVSAGDRGRDSRAAVPDRQPVKTAAPTTTTDSRAKSSSASTAGGGQLTASSQPRSSTSTNTSTTVVRSERPPADKASDRTPTKVSDHYVHEISIARVARFF